MFTRIERLQPRPLIFLGRYAFKFQSSTHYVPSSTTTSGQVVGLLPPPPPPRLTWDFESIGENLDLPPSVTHTLVDLRGETVDQIAALEPLSGEDALMAFLAMAKENGAMCTHSILSVATPDRIPTRNGHFSFQASRDTNGVYGGVWNGPCAISTLVINHWQAIISNFEITGFKRENGAMKRERCPWWNQHDSIGDSGAMRSDAQPLSPLKSI